MDRNRYYIRPRNISEALLVGLCRRERSWDAEHLVGWNWRYYLATVAGSDSSRSGSATELRTAECVMVLKFNDGTWTVQRLSSVSRVLKKLFVVRYEFHSFQLSVLVDDELYFFCWYLWRTRVLVSSICQRRNVVCGGLFSCWNYSGDRIGTQIWLLEPELKFLQSTRAFFCINMVDFSFCICTISRYSYW